MGKISELYTLLEDLKRSGEAVVSAAEEIGKMLCEVDESAGSKTLENGSTGDEAAKPNEAATSPKRTVTLEELRGALAKLNKKGFKEQVKKLLQDYGAERLSALDPEKYAEVIAEAEGIEDAG